MAATSAIAPPRSSAPSIAGRTSHRVVEDAIRLLQASGIRDQQLRGSVEIASAIRHRPGPRQDRRSHEHVVGPSLAVLWDTAVLLLERGLSALDGEPPCRRV